MTFGFFLIFNAEAFAETGLVSRSLSHNLDGIGVREFLVTQGNLLAVTHDGEFIPVPEAGGDVRYRGEFAVAQTENGDVYFGFEESP